jgi:hypothetical protein
LIPLGDIGNLGEARAIAWLQKQGYYDIVVIKNSIGNGIDAAATTPDGRLTFFEIKSSAIGQIKDLQPRQQNMNTYVTDILTQAADGTGRYKNISPEMQQAAANLLRRYQSDPMSVSGTVVGVDLQNNQLFVSPWPGRPLDR